MLKSNPTLRILTAITIALVSSLACVAQDPTPVKRPATPSPSTINSSTSQTGAWYKYAVYLEAVIAVRNATIASQTTAIETLKTELNTLKVDIAKVDQILTVVKAIETKLATLPPPTADTLGPNEVRAGKPATIYATLEGIPPFAFEWRKSGLTLPGATTDRLVITSAAASDAADYEVIVSKGNDRASATMTLVVVP